MGKKGCARGAIYLALEENQRRLQKRLSQLDKGWASAKSLTLHTEWPRFQQGGLEHLENAIKTLTPRVVVIDTLAKVRPLTGRNANAYEADYNAVAPLTTLASKYRCCILIITHNRKGKSEEDPLEQISGTLGLAGAVDGALVIEGARGDQTAKLTLVGRDIEQDGEFAIQRLATGGWDWLGKAESVFISQARQELIDALKLHGPMTPKGIADLLGKGQGATRKLLRDMLGSMQVQCDRGVYTSV